MCLCSTVNNMNDESNIPEIADSQPPTSLFGHVTSRIQQREGQDTLKTRSNVQYIIQGWDSRSAYDELKDKVLTIPIGV